MQTIAPAAVPHQPTIIYKDLVWEANYNNKLLCLGFTHIDLAPKQMPTFKQMEETVFIISHKEYKNAKHYFRLIDIKPVRADLLPEGVIAASHGMTSTDFFDMMFKKYQPAFSWSSMLAIYFYLRFKP